MISKVTETIETNGMFPAPCDVVAGLSGGADSMAMLHALLSLREQYGLRLTAAHVQHGLRGEEAERDAEFVVDWCRENNIPLEVHSCDVRALATESGEGLEECGRRVRYAFFSRLCVSKHARIATAHTLNDSAETMLLHLARGSGVQGLCGIPAVRGQIVRPLIGCSRADIEAYCAEHRIPYVTDSTNTDIAYARNRVRQNVMPEFETLNQNYLAAFERTAEILREEHNFLDAMAKQLVKDAAMAAGFDAKRLRALPPAIIRRALKQILNTHTGETPAFEHVEAVAELLKTGGQVQIGGGALIAVQKDVLRFPIQDRPEPFSMIVQEGIFHIPGGIVNSFSVTYEYFKNNQENYKNKFAFYVDCDKISGKLIARNRMGGDAFRPAGRNCTKTVKQLFQEQGVPPDIRGRMPVFCDDMGVAGIPGCAADERLSVSGQSKHVLVVQIQEDMYA